MIVSSCDRVCGLTEEDLVHIKLSLAKFEKIERAAIFGSRAIGTFGIGSDIDLALWGSGIDSATMARLKYELEEQGPLPYLFDIVDYKALRSGKLREHIDIAGIIIYRKQI